MHKQLVLACAITFSLTLGIGMAIQYQIDKRHNVQVVEKLKQLNRMIHDHGRYSIVPLDCDTQELMCDYQIELDEDAAIQAARSVKRHIKKREHERTKKNVQIEMN